MNRANNALNDIISRDKKFNKEDYHTSEEFRKVKQLYILAIGSL